MLTTDHRDLRDGTTPSESAELQEAQKQAPERLVGDVRRAVRCYGGGVGRVPDTLSARQSELLSGERHQSKPWTQMRLGKRGGC